MTLKNTNNNNNNISIVPSLEHRRQTQTQALLNMTEPIQQRVSIKIEIKETLYWKSNDHTQRKVHHKVASSFYLWVAYQFKIAAKKQKKPRDCPFSVTQMSVSIQE